MEDLKESAPYDRVVLHPLVLLSAVDHFNRIGNVSRNARVVGALLGATKVIDGKRVLDISNSFAVPFDEDSKDSSVWYLDHDYLDEMFKMYRKVNAKERIVGWYHTGPELRANDTEINEIFKEYSKNSILSVIETTTNDWSLPTRSYYCIEEVHDDGTPSTKTFSHLPSEMGAEEAEEVGVEHLLRDVHSNTQGTLSQKISNQIKGLKGFSRKLGQIAKYLEDVSKGNLPMNYNIIYGLQDIFNYLPDVAQVGFNDALQQVTNDQMLIVYLASMIKSVVALHNLIDNKLDMNEKEKQDEAEEEAERKKKYDEKLKKEAEKKESDLTNGNEKGDGLKDSDTNSGKETSTNSKNGPSMNDTNSNSKNSKICNLDVDERRSSFTESSTSKSERDAFNQEFEEMSFKLQTQLVRLVERLGVDHKGNSDQCSRVI